MGCDIHMYVEYRPKARHDVGWCNGDHFILDEPLSVRSEMKRIELYRERNYPLFSVLADVRNYDYLTCIDYPRGIPEDATEYVMHEYFRWGMDAHSCSYFTLRELIDYRDEEHPRDPFGRDILEPIIGRLTKRADELGLIWVFEWDNHDTRDATLEKAENIRIVFWFDN